MDRRLSYYAAMLYNYIDLHGEVTKILNPAEALTVTPVPEHNSKHNVLLSKQVLI